MEAKTMHFLKEFFRNIKFTNEYFKYAIILIFTFIIKVSYFNFSTGMPFNKIKYILVTVCVFFLVLTLLYRAKKWYLGVSGLITLIMFGDLLYFRYFNDFLSIKLMNQATFVGSVTSIIFSIIKATDILLFVDLIAFVFITKAKGPLQLYTHKISFIMMIIILPSIILSISFSSIYTGIKKYEFFNYHVYDIISLDTENNQLSSSERNALVDSLRTVHRESASGNYFGIAKDRNVIVVQVESLQNELIGKFYNGQEITPNINKILGKDSIYFSNYYQQLGKGNTSDAEFTTLNSLYPITSGNTYNVYEKNGFYGLPWIMREHGYSASSYHGYTASFWNRMNIYPQIGFENSYFSDDYVMGEKIVFGLDDHDFFDQTIPYMKEKGEKSFSFLVTLSSHKPFELPEDKRWIALQPEDDNFFGHYLQSVNYADDAFGKFIESLKAEGMYDNSVIIFYGDHFGIGMEDEVALERMEAFMGSDYTHEDMFNIPLVVHIPNSGVQETVDITGGQIDFLPTTLNLLGIKNEYLILGQDLLNTEDGFVASQTFMEKGSFIDNDVVFKIARDGVFENSTAYDRDTHEPVSLELCREGYERAIFEINLSKKITESDSVFSIVTELQNKDGKYELE